VVGNGVIQIDDYGHWTGCRQAIEEFARSRQTAFALRAIDYTGVWFRKENTADYAPWQTLWSLAQLSAQCGQAPQAERLARAVLKLIPGLLKAEALLVALGSNPAEFDRQPQEIPQFLTTDPSAELLQDLKLRALNLIVFPDWQLPEPQLWPTLVSLFRQLLTHPHHGQITLLIHVGNSDVADVELTISGVLMYLLTEEDLTVEAEPELTLIQQFDQSQWQLLLPHLTARIALEFENEPAIAQLNAAIAEPTALPHWPLDEQFAKIRQTL
jgi:hypothetical protein